MVSRRVGYACVAAVGYGCFSASLAGEPAAIYLARGVLGTPAQVIAMQVVTLAAACAACLVVRWLAKTPVSLGCTRPVGACTAAATLVCLGAYALLSARPSLGVALAAQVVIGCVASYPHVAWYDELLRLYRDVGHLFAIGLMIAAECLCALVALLTYLASSLPLGPAVASALTGAAALACQLAVPRLRAHLTSPSTPTGRREPAQGRARYRLTSQSVVLLASFGLTWGMASGLVSEAESGPTSLVALSTAAVLCTGAVMYAGARGDGGTNFGFLARVSVAAAGIMLAAMPLVGSVAPALVRPACECVATFQGVAMTLLSVDICASERLPVADVMPVNYAVFAVAGCVAMAVTGALAAPGAPLAREWFSLLVMLATACAIPTIPNRASNAANSTMKRPPEDLALDERISALAASLAERCALTPREADVLGLLLRGRTRQEVAQELGLSEWTVKGYTTNVYRKTGVHSAKDLMVLIGDANA